MKLRMLNGTHSSLAYLGYLAGHETIAETVADPLFARFVKNLWRQEIIPSFEAPPGVDLEATRMRFSNAMQIPASGTAPGRLPWTAARNCLSVFSAPCATT